MSHCLYLRCKPALAQLRPTQSEEPSPPLRFSVVWFDCNDVLMMQRVYTAVPWSMAWLSLRCVEECGRLWKSLTALVSTAPSGRAQAAGVGCPGVFGIPGSWMTEQREREREGDSAQLPSMSARLHWLSMEREQGDRDGSLGGPSVMDYTVENTFRALTACSVLRAFG